VLSVPLTVTGLTPAAGSLAGGTTITLIGTGFSSNPALVSLRFGTSACQVTAITPAATSADELALVLAALRDSVASGAMQSRIGIPIMDVSVRVQLVEPPSLLTQQQLGDALLPLVLGGGGGAAGGAAGGGLVSMEPLLASYAAVSNSTGGVGTAGGAGSGAGGAAGGGGQSKAGASKVYAVLLGVFLSVGGVAALGLFVVRARRLHSAGMQVAGVEDDGGGEVGVAGAGVQLGRMLGESLFVLVRGCLVRWLAVWATACVIHSHHHQSFNRDQTKPFIPPPYDKPNRPNRPHVAQPAQASQPGRQEPARCR